MANVALDAQVWPRSRGKSTQLRAARIVRGLRKHGVDVRHKRVRNRLTPTSLTGEGWLYPKKSPPREVSGLQKTGCIEQPDSTRTSLLSRAIASASQAVYVLSGNVTGLSTSKRRTPMDSGQSTEMPN